MTAWRIGTRGSELALAQTRWVCAHLRRHEPSLEFEEVIITTHGDRQHDQPVSDAAWPVGGFVGSIERALLAGEVDLAVHSLKDLPVEPTPGLTVAAVPVREAAHDVLIARSPVGGLNLPRGWRIGTGSARRAAQLRMLGEVEVVPIRGNVPTRLAMVGRESDDGLDAVMLAAAGLHRLGLRPAQRINLPPDRVLPAPGQGALAVQVRANDPRAQIIAGIEHRATRLAVDAERHLLAAFGAGCSVPLGAHAIINSEGRVTLRAQLFIPGNSAPATGSATGGEPAAVAETLARRLAGDVARFAGGTP